MSKPDPGRRRILIASLKLAPLAVLGRSFAAHAAAPERAASPERALTFFNTHTEEELAATYFSGGKYHPATLERFNTILRDHRNGEVGKIDPALLNFLFDVAERAGAAPAFDVISGWRSQASNDLLRARSSGVAKGSLHLQGKAIDVRLRGVKVANLHDVALGLRRGGVGYYPKADFVHLDTGRVRSWNG